MEDFKPLNTGDRAVSGAFRCAVPAYNQRMRISSRRGTIAFFVVLCVCLVVVALSLNISWVVLHLRDVGLLVMGIVFFAVIIAGLVLNTIFLVREVRRNEQHDSFINAVTHELKTPIASIRLYLETLQSRPVDDTQRREFYRIMHEDTDRLIQTVEQVLRAGEAGHKRQESHRMPLDLTTLAGDCVELARTRYHLSQEAMVYAAGGHYNVIGDADELRAAIGNVLDNAVKFSGGRDNVQISVSVRVEQKDRVSIRVSDCGIGIARADLGRIFKRFYRVHNRAVSQVKGTGLGLFIVRSIARKHGGDASAASAGEGHGTTVTIELPLAPAATPEASPQALTTARRQG